VVLSVVGCWGDDGLSGVDIDQKDLWKLASITGTGRPGTSGTGRPGTSAFGAGRWVRFLWSLTLGFAA
jgi:hypothetical protein